MNIKGSDIKAIIQYSKRQAEYDEVPILDYGPIETELSCEQQYAELEKYSNASQQLTNDNYILVNENIMIAATRLIKNVANSSDITENAKQDLLAAIHLLVKE